MQNVIYTEYNSFPKTGTCKYPNCESYNKPSVTKTHETEAFSMYISHLRKSFDNAASGGNAAAKLVGNRVHQISLQFECKFSPRFQDQILQNFRVFFNVVFKYSPDVLNRCKVWRIGGPLQTLNPFWSCTVLLQDQPSWK